MTERFQTVGHPVTWVAPVLQTDPRVASVAEEKRLYSIMYNHLDMIAAFLAGTADYGIFCEDDIFIRRDFANSVRVAIDGYNRQGADVMLLGYLISYKPFTYNVHGYHSALEQPFAFLSVYPDLWGSQMYMMDRSSARRVLDSCSDPNKVSGPFSPDWVLTKFGKVVAIYPMLAIEEGIVVTDHAGQRNFHELCFQNNYNKDIHI